MDMKQKGKADINTVSTVKEPVRINKRYLALIAIVVFLVVVFSIISNGFLCLSNMMNIIRQTSILAIVSVGMTYVILTGGVDLSVPNNIALSGLIAGVVLNKTENMILAAAASIGAAMLVGIINGELVGRFRLNAFIATLSTNTILGGICVYITNGKSISITGFDEFLYLGRGDIGGMPVSLIVVLLVFIIFTLLSTKFHFGRDVYAVGGNSSAAKAMGIPVERKTVQVYMLAGFLVGVASIVNIGRLGSAQPYAGSGLDFEAITAVVLGGTSLVGGIGGLGGTIIGTILMGVITNGLGLLSMSQYYLFIIKGVLILVTVGTDLMVYRRNEIKLTPKVETDKTNQREEPGVVEVLAREKNKVLEMHNIVKAYPGMKALDNVSLKVSSGKVHALMGENGAGKSTLMQIMLGENSKSAGYITINGKIVDIDSPKKAERLGIAMIHQENALVKSLSIAENMFLGKELKNKLPMFINKYVMNRETAKVLKEVNLSVSPKTSIKDLTVSEQQLVEIAKALNSKAWLLVMDEPTSSLTEDEKDKLFEIINELRKQGSAIVYISHRMQEIYEISDEITVLRDGHLIATDTAMNITADKLIKLMVGRELNNVFDRKPNELGDVVLKVEHLSKKGMFNDISFDVKAGEVIGFGGLVGAGRTEVMKTIFGLYKKDEGKVILDNKELQIRSVRDAMDYGIAYLTEDRKLEGFVPYLSIAENITLPSYKELSKLGRINRKRATEIVDKYIEDLHIKTTSRDKNVIELSGGNQQKVSLGKWLARDIRVLILDEPTRGVDIGAKEEIHKIIGEISKKGIAIILISSEMPELIGCADRIIVMRSGRISGMVDAKEVEQDDLMRLAAL